MTTIYAKDEYDKDILLSEQGSQVMMEWEKPYMEACIDALEPSGDVLEIGFGLGYSATHILNYKPKSYTIIECDQVVIERIKKWALDYPETPIHIIEGRWQNKLQELDTFDTIFFDDFPLNINKQSKKIEQLLSQQRLLLFMDKCISNNTHIGSKISFYANSYDNKIGFSSNIQPFIEIENFDTTIMIPLNCKYRKTGLQKCSIPIIKKVKKYDKQIALEYTEQIKKIVNYNKSEIEKQIKNMFKSTD